MSSSPRDGPILSSDIDSVNSESIVFSESQETELSAPISPVAEKSESIPINGNPNDRPPISTNRRSLLVSDSDFRISRSLGDSGEEKVIDEKILLGLKDQGSSLDEKQILKEEKSRRIGSNESTNALHSQLELMKKQLLLEIKRRKLLEGKISKRVFCFQTYLLIC